jgi:hypothetical protein
VVKYLLASHFSLKRYPEPRRQRVRIIRRKSESPIPVSETQWAFSVAIFHSLNLLTQ